MQRKRVSFSKRVFTGLGLGIVYGLILNFLTEQIHSTARIYAMV